VELAGSALEAQQFILRIMQSELVEKRRWIDSDHFFHALSHCMLLPGPEAQQLATYIGWKLHGKNRRVPGWYLVCSSLDRHPPGAQFCSMPDTGPVWWVTLLFRVLKPIVVALVLRALFQIGRRVLRSRLRMVCCNRIVPRSQPDAYSAALDNGNDCCHGCPSGASPAPERARPLLSEEKTVGYAPGARALADDAIVVDAPPIGSLPLLLIRNLRARFPVLDQAVRLFHTNSLCDPRRSYTVIPYVAQVSR